MKKLIVRFAVLTGIIFSGTVVLSSCSKNDTNTATYSSNKDYFTSNMLNRDLIVSFAIDDTTNITVPLSGYTFHLVDSSAFSGSITASNITRTVVGTWSIDASYNTITFSFPQVLEPYIIFISKQWQFVNRSSPTIMLKAADGESDQLQLIKK